MIKKAQIKFISIIMSILLGVFAVISGVSIIALNNSNNRNIDHALDEMVKTIPYAEVTPPQTNSFIIKTLENDWQLISIDQTAFNTDQLTIIVNDIRERQTETGRIDNVYYKFVQVRSEAFLIGLDASNYKSELDTSILRIFLVFLVIYLFLFVIVFLFSFSVFEPIKEAFAKQKQFVSNASHELKTPLTIISANADVLKQEDSNKWVDNIKNQTERLDTIVTDMLEMAKIDEKTVEIKKEEFNLSDEIIKNALPFDALAFEKGKTLDLDILPDVIYKGDKEGIKKVVNILLDNAVKYASKEGLIKISLYKKNGKNILSVYNTGSAVPANQANKIFERFYRFDNSRARETGGSGLGLSIAKGIADANKWKISAISKPNDCMIINVIL